MKVRSPMEIYRHLPQTNCGECGEMTCMAFASLLKERKKKLEECPPLMSDEYAEQREKIAEMLAPEIREVEIGVGDKAVKIGGEEVLHRHELTFFNRTALFYDVWDTLDADSLRERVHKIESWKKFYVGEFLRLNGIAVRSVSNDPEKFEECVKKVADTTDLPLVLCSFDPKIVERGLKHVAERRPLIYAATERSWSAFLELSKMYEVPVALFSQSLDVLTSLAVTFANAGVEDIVLDPCTHPMGKGLADTFTKFVKIRRAGIADGRKEIAYPLLSVPLTAWFFFDDPVEASYWEAIVASIFIIKYADIMILHGLQPHSLIVERTLVETIYTDPRRPVSVEPGLRIIGNPDGNSPLFLTTNFALTYYTVESDISSNKIDSYLLVVDTDGLGVEAAVAGGQLNADKVKDALEQYVDSRIEHKTIVIPGLAARISGETEEKTGWKVLVGPKDSGRIPDWIDKNWPPEV
ncbi:acetyl-CoA decarbonylase/synthase complex subunit gamma [Methanosarcinales archaeon]|nr:MAG: acetyl-CoA decarbonylase/synthase complex subunit gamma [Methanosarcinales archaeon]